MKNGNVELKFCRPSGAPARQPSRAMADALQHLSEADEMQCLVSEAEAHGRKVVVQVFHSAEGHPILIHLGSVPQEAA
jgi:hypothetical protein